jgi:hypothetical protein
MESTDETSGPNPRPDESALRAEQRFAGAI